jgi:hypothetical protein
MLYNNDVSGGKEMLKPSKKGWIAKAAEFVPPHLRGSLEAEWPDDIAEEFERMREAEVNGGDEDDEDAVGEREEEVEAKAIEDLFPESAADVASPSSPSIDVKGRKEEVDISVMQIDQLGLKNKSQIIRYLDREGYAPKAIAKFLDVRYQHVRNVLVNPPKRPTTK